MTITPDNCIDTCSAVDLGAVKWTPFGKKMHEEMKDYTPPPYDPNAPRVWRTPNEALNNLDKEVENAE